MKFLPMVERRLSGVTALVVWAVVFQLLYLVYSPSLKGPFIFDDFGGVVNNADLRHPDQLWRAFGDHASSLEFDRRPVAGILTTANFQLSALNPVGYRIVNLLLHFLVALILSRLLTGISQRMGAAFPRVY